MAKLILVFNTGSSSIKFGVYDATGRHAHIRGSVAATDGADAYFRAYADDGHSIADERWSGEDKQTAIQRVVIWLENRLGEEELIAAGHRVVHGGSVFSSPVLIDEDVMRHLVALTPLAPLHQSGSLAPIRTLATFRPGLRQVACFDTAFHCALEPPASRYAIPRALEEQGIRRYGFHGLSYESIARALGARGCGAEKDLIIAAHLGSGASLCAMKALRSVDTTMGFSALDGVVMGTRPGTLDPGILLYLMREKGYDLDRLERLLYHECGLAGISGIGSDVELLLASGRIEARAALEQFAYSVAGHIAMLTMTLGGLDRLVFTGGIGENAWQLREMIADRLRWLGIALDAVANRANSSRISMSSSAVRVEIIAADEEATIAHHTAAACDPYGDRQRAPDPTKAPSSRALG